MCNFVFLSTTSEEDLSPVGGGLFTLCPVEEIEREEVVRLLQHPHRWYLQSRYGGCSCDFRHSPLLTPEFGHMVAVEPVFGPPDSGDPEDEDVIESTQAVYDLLSRLVSDGHEVDVVDADNGTPVEVIKTIQVSLSEVPRDSFRFLEGYRFELRE